MRPTATPGHTGTPERTTTGEGRAGPEAAGPDGAPAPAPQTGAGGPVGGTGPHGPARRRWSGLWPAGPLLAALALWTYAVRTTEITTLDDFGLVTAVHPTYWAGLVVLTVGFWFTVRRPDRSEGWSLAYVLGLLVIERATQALVYPTPLYAWAWKHDAVVGHLLTAGGLQTGAELGDMAVYDQWPGFFALQAAAVRLAGVEDTLTLMSWWPLLSGVLVLAPLVLIHRTFTQDRRLIWTGVWLFCVGNWVGQDYFSPQSLALVLHLTVIALVLRRFTAAERRAPGQAVWTTVLILVMVPVVLSHQLTPVMTIMSLGVLALTRRHRDWVPFLAAVALFAAWNLTASLPFLSAALPEMIASIGDIGSNVETGYGTTPTGTGAVATSWAARALSGVVVLLAALGVLRQRELRAHARPLLLLTVVPLLLIAANDYGSEMIFRVLMFMLPGAAFFAAAALLPRTGAAVEAPPRPAPARHVWLPLPVLLIASLAFVPAYAGKDRLSYFPPDEVALVGDLVDRAPDRSLIVAPNRNYPLAYDDYWRVDHYWFLEEDRAVVDGILRRPAFMLALDMKDLPEPGRSYLLFTEGQRANAEMNGQLTEDEWRRIEASVADSPFFDRVAGNAAGSVYELDVEAIEEAAR
ncbi:glycosyltransferase [Streptomyces sp. NPDC005012]|uniref:glycosyltransferase n=1 Tax=Streptomyces sp. NPDC005012 TaxID=3154558 RepID=UPI0033B79049